MDKIPIFDGVQIEIDSWPTCGQFVDMVEKHAKKNSLTEDETKTFLQTKLASRALALIQTNCNEPLQEQIALLKKYFSLKLSIKEKVEVRKNLQQQPTESIDDFYNRCLHAQYLVSFDDDDRDATFKREVLIHFLIGLTPIIRDEVLSANCSSPEDFIAEAKKHFVIVKEEPENHVDVELNIKVEGEDAFEDLNDMKVDMHEEEEGHDVDYQPMEENAEFQFDEDEDKSFKCDKCGKSFKNQTRLRNHKKIKHPTWKTRIEKTEMMCEHCPAEFETHELKKEHEDSVHGHLSTNCELCKEEFPSFKVLANHLTRKHCETDPQGKIICFICHTFQRKALDQVRYHILAEHYHCPNHICKFCKKPFMELHRLDQHVKTIHLDENPHQCDKCEKSFKTKQGLKMHYIVNHAEQTAMKCGIDGCEKIFPNEVNLRAHRVNSHKSESCTFVCDTCGKNFRQKESLRMHNLQNHATSEEQEKNLIRCKDTSCDYTSLSKPKMVEHYKRCHLKLKNAQCPHCPSAFYKPERLNEHINGIHLGLKPYKCDLCDFRTAYRKISSEHKKVAHGNQRFDCPYCTHSARYKGNLTKHLRNVHKRDK